ncbi:hypothetical protein [Spiroplasma endosymbiont of Colias croceus]|uniref:hypothetical protein n=1 Tax=Spiroplasma endosymbiont of Colias croceus TaxID=3066310 RepID=UPI0030D2AEFB
MESFNWDKNKNYNSEELESLLEQHRNFVYKTTKTELEPKLSEYETKLKEYENKVNIYEEEKLFNGFNDKQKEMSKLLMTSKYNNLSKAEALNKIKEDYAEIFNNNLHNKEIKKQEIIKNEELLKNTEVVGAKTKQEMIKFLEFLFSK